MEQYITLILDDIKPGMVNPKIGDDVEFVIYENFMRELRRKLFAGIDNEDAYEHVRMVLEIMDLFHFSGVTHDAIMLRVFPITLKGRALRWKNRLPAWTITTWDLLKKEFIWKYRHPFITAKNLEGICNFKQEMDETLYHALERYNDLLYQCLLHDLNYQQNVHIFYTGLDISSRKIVDWKMMVFPITLKGRALRWKNILPAGTITTWDLLRKEFIWRYCHPFITAKKLENIRNFKQERDETLYHALERYNDLLYQCLLHDLNYQQNVHIFYTGLDISSRKIVDSNGFIPLMTPTQALNQYKSWHTNRMTGEKVKVITTMGKENMKEPVPHDLSPTPFLGHLKEQMGSPYRTRETVRMIGNPEEIHNAKAQEDKGDMDVGWDITSKDVAKKEYDNPATKTYDCETFIRKLLHQDPGTRRHLSRTARLIIMWQIESMDRGMGTKIVCICGRLISYDLERPPPSFSYKFSDMTMEQYITLIPDDIKPSIVNPKIGDDVGFEINANFMRELRRKLFIGTDDEDAYEHVRTVLEIVDLFHFPGVTHDAIMLRVFLVTLKGRALRWKNRLPSGTITT
ncbi:ribonuclease H-like domain-containing protein [Tanacetum coccineum]